MTNEYGLKSSKRSVRWGSGVLLGCFSVAAGAMLVLIALSFLVPRALDRMVETYTDVAPVVFESPEVSEEAGGVLRDRVKKFSDDLEEGVAEEDLTLTEDEVNFLLEREFRDEGIDGSLRVELLQETITAEVSLPVNAEIPLGPWSRSVRGRYLNGIATVRMAVVGDKVELEIDSVAVKGKEMPGWMLRWVEQGIAELRLLEGEDVREVVERLEFLEVQDGRVIVRPNPVP